LDSTEKPPNVFRTISDLALLPSAPQAESIPTSATQDFEPSSAPKDTSPPENPLSPPKLLVTDPLPTNTETNGEVAAADSAPAPPTEDKAGLRVLLVEDNEINLKLLIATMRKLKLDHATATNGLEAFNSYKESEGKFDVVFMG
jgi:CheY-like chemotaxis protein